MDRIIPKKIEYSLTSNDYWKDRAGESSCNPWQIAELVITTCGVQKMLDVGCGEGFLVEELLRRGIDAYGVDVSNVVVERCSNRIPDRYFHGSVLTLQCHDEEFQTVISMDCLEYLAPKDVPKALREIYRITKRNAFLQVATTPDKDDRWQLIAEDRSWWEAQCFEAGFRKHPDYYIVNDYESLNREECKIIIPLEKIPASALQSYQLTALTTERDLHMDMLRETGSRSDAHVIRYQIASQYVRTGDTVLDAACGLGYGTHVLANTTKAKNLIGIDSSVFAIEYATANYSDGNRVSYRQGRLPQCLSAIPDNSIDLVVCFETLEHVEESHGLLSEFFRVLSPGGRLIASVPNDWSDETGEDPSPYHLQVYDYANFTAQLTEHFDIEFMLGQVADRTKKFVGGGEWVARPRSLRNVHLDGDSLSIQAEWLIAVASKSPIAGGSVPYVEKMFTAQEQAVSGNALAFARDYINPWLIRSLVSIGARIENLKVREKWANQVLKCSPPDSADYGAALCILAYLELEKPIAPIPKGFFENINSYLSVNHENNPNIFRWKISLSYVKGLFLLRCGNRTAAMQCFEYVIFNPVSSYSPTLLTKVVDAAFLLSVMYLASGKAKDANSIAQVVFNKSLNDVGKYLGNTYSEMPPGFEIREITTVISRLGRLLDFCQNAKWESTAPFVFRTEISADIVTQRAWLENQWKSQKEVIETLRLEMVKLEEGKQWLENQWKSQKEVIETLRLEKLRLASQLKRIKGQRAYRLLCKLKILRSEGE